jgi:flagellar protein FlaG
MTGEITSSTQNLLSATRELSGSALNRVGQAQQVSGTRPVSGQGDQEGGPQGLQGPTAGADQDPAPEERELGGTVSDLNDLVQHLRRELQFSVEEESGTLVVKIIDKETDEVVRQIPPEDLLVLKQRLADAAGAIFQDEA